MKRNKKAEAKTRSKVVVRHLPPSLSRSDFFGLIDPLFADCYSRTSFRPGKKSSRRDQKCSRAYIDFKRPEEVSDFAEFFDGHVFVNEKGAHFKAIVEYAPYQQVPMPCPRDGCEGTIYKDPDYLEFLKLIAKPVENLQKPAVQLEAIEVEQAEEAPVVTPLMEFVRQKRAGSGVQDVPAVRKTRRKAHKISKGRRGLTTIKHGQAKNKNAPEDNKKDVNGRDKPENANRNPKLGEKKTLLLKGKVEVSEGELSSIVNSTVLINSKQSHLHKSGEKLIQTILLSNEAHLSSSGVQPKISPKILGSRKQLHHDTNLESSVTYHVPEYVEKTTGYQLVSKELHATDNIHGKLVKHEQVMGVRSRSRTAENGSKRYFGHRELGHSTINERYGRKDNDFVNKSSVKSSKQATNEKRVWVQKSSLDSGK